MELPESADPSPKMETQSQHSFALEQPEETKDELKVDSKEASLNQDEEYSIDDEFADPLSARPPSHVMQQVSSRNQDVDKVLDRTSDMKQEESANDQLSQSMSQRSGNRPK